MHSSPLLFAHEFQAKRGDRVAGSLPLAEVFPDYHSQDRIAIVANTWEDAFIENAAGVAALTAMFYDAQRATGKPFYTYPSHYLLLCQGPDGLRTRTGTRPLPAKTAGYPWGNVDVWPETQWIDVTQDTTALMRVLFAQHIHRLIWPEDLPIMPATEKLPGYMRLIMASRLKTVHYYDSRSPDLSIEASPNAKKLFEASPRHFKSDFAPPTHSRYRTVDPEEFMRRVDVCFEKPPEKDED